MQKSEDHLRAAWEEFRPELSRLVRALEIGATNADDILQDVYLTAQEKRPPDLDFEDLRRWLIRVTVNRCRLEHRRTGCWRKAFGGLTRIFDRHCQNGSVAESVERDEERTQIRQALHLLDTDARTLLVLRYFAEFDSTEIGRILNVNEATVRGRLRNARQKLAEELRRTGYK